MTDRENLQFVLDYCHSDDIETIFKFFLENFKDNLSINKINELHNLAKDSLEYKINRLEEARFTANERATYIKKYLEGKMWKDEEIAKMYVQQQIENVQAIIDVCK